MERVGLQPARYIQAAAYRTISQYRDTKRHDISISLLGYDMITTQYQLKTVQSDNSTTFEGKPDLPKWITVAIINIASARNACNNNCLLYKHNISDLLQHQFKFQFRI